jgi:hypothetical protein
MEHIKQQGRRSFLFEKAPLLDPRCSGITPTPPFGHGVVSTAAEAEPWRTNDSQPGHRMRALVARKGWKGLRIAPFALRYLLLVVSAERRVRLFNCGGGEVIGREGLR